MSDIGIWDKSNSEVYPNLVSTFCFNYSLLNLIFLCIYRYYSVLNFSD